MSGLSVGSQVRVRVNRLDGSSREVASRIEGVSPYAAPHRQRNAHVSIVVSRKALQAEVVKANARTVWVRLPGGRVIQRKLRRDVEGGAA